MLASAVEPASPTSPTAATAAGALGRTLAPLSLSSLPPLPPSAPPSIAAMSPSAFSSFGGSSSGSRTRSNSSVSFSGLSNAGTIVGPASGFPSPVSSHYSSASSGSSSTRSSGDGSGSVQLASAPGSTGPKPSSLLQRRASRSLSLSLPTSPLFDFDPTDAPMISPSLYAPTLIAANLYLGSQQSLRYLRGVGHTLRHPTALPPPPPSIAVLNVAEELPPLSPRTAQANHAHHYLHLPMSHAPHLADHLPAALNFIETHLAAGRTVLVHCMCGVSRSAAVVLAYLMWKVRWGFRTAYEHVRTRRAISPNMHLVCQLVEFAMDLDLPTDEPATAPGTPPLGHRTSVASFASTMSSVSLGGSAVGEPESAAPMLDPVSQAVAVATAAVHAAHARAASEAGSPIGSPMFSAGLPPPPLSAPALSSAAPPAEFVQSPHVVPDLYGTSPSVHIAPPPLAVPSHAGGPPFRRLSSAATGHHHHQYGPGMSPVGTPPLGARFLARSASISSLASVASSVASVLSSASAALASPRSAAMLDAFPLTDPDLLAASRGGASNAPGTATTTTTTTSSVNGSTTTTTTRPRSRSNPTLPSRPSSPASTTSHTTPPMLATIPDVVMAEAMPALALKSPLATSPRVGFGSAGGPAVPALAPAPLGRARRGFVPPRIQTNFGAARGGLGLGGLASAPVAANSIPFPSLASAAPVENAPVLPPPPPPPAVAGAGAGPRGGAPGGLLLASGFSSSASASVSPQLPVLVLHPQSPHQPSFTLVASDPPPSPHPMTMMMAVDAPPLSPMFPPPPPPPASSAEDADSAAADVRSVHRFRAPAAGGLRGRRPSLLQQATMNGKPLPPLPPTPTFPPSVSAAPAGLAPAVGGGPTAWGSTAGWGECPTPTAAGFRGFFAEGGADDDDDSDLRSAMDVVQVTESASSQEDGSEAMVV
ncbi:tyrosine/serine/threonine protein phosphatase [Blastocladiella emersonii ATCC 22665]|nr:tyrosine/serine/threonine protein phosphatase [Blastocladiella emersonii ATCC 22665]